MRIKDMINKVNRYLAGEMEDYNNLIDLMDAVVDDVNAKLNTCFPVISEWAKFVEEYNDKVREHIPFTKTTQVYVYTVKALPETQGDDVEPEAQVINPGVLDEVLQLVPTFIRNRDDFHYSSTAIDMTKTTTKEVVLVPEPASVTEETYVDDDGIETYTYTIIDCDVDHKFLLDPLDYTAIPDKYLRTLIVGVAYKYYIRDEEGEKVASEYWQNYQQALFEILRDYDQYVPDVFRSHRKGYITGHGGEMNDPFCRFYNIFR